ncbi:MAG: hypothetical protein IJ842_06140 [Bacilli bacterium]|nr:hypothetical protein [Bacilli bacterium]
MKNIKKIFIIVAIIIGSFYIFKYFKNNIKSNYVINKIKIEEYFSKDKGHNYDFRIKTNKGTYVFNLEKNLNSSTKIIKNIKKYNKNTIECILITYKDNKNELYCLNNKKQVSLYYLKNNNDFITIKNKIKNNKLVPTSYNEKKDYKKITVYNKNISNDELFTVWDYKGIYLCSNKENKYKKILKNDLYENILITAIDKYFILFDNTSVKGINKIYYYDTKKDKLNTMTFKNYLSNDIYINGIVDETIIITDKKEKKEYSLNILKKELKEIDNDQTNYVIYENGIKKNISKSDYFMKEQIIDNNKYYYQYENNIFYKYHKKYKNNKILLFEQDNIDDYFIKNDEIIIIKEGKVYSYKDNTGLRLILESNELNYNYKNIVSLIKNK